MDPTARPSRYTAYDQVLPAIEIGTALQLSLTARHERLTSRFVGTEPGVYWIVADPLQLSGTPYPVALGSPISVRYRFRGAVYGFVADLLARVESPGRLLFLRSPELVARHALRTAPRIDCQLPCTVAAGASEWSGKLLDISPEGCRCTIRLPQELDAAPFCSGDELVLNLKLPGIAYEPIVWGEVKNLKTEPGRVRFGLHFDQLDIDAQSRLAEFLAAVQDI